MDSIPPIAIDGGAETGLVVKSDKRLGNWNVAAPGTGALRSISNKERWRCRSIATF